MRILIDAHMVGAHETGNETYILNLVRALLALDGPEEYLLAHPEPDVLATRLGGDVHGRLRRVSPHAWRRLLMDLPALVRRDGVDLLHVTYAGPPRCGCPTVVTVHDVSYREHPEWFSLRDRCVLRAGVGVTLRRATRVLTVSAFSRQEICRLYGLPESRVRVTLEAADPVFAPPPPGAATEAALERLGVTRPYVLALGNIQPRKNLARAVEAFGLLAERGFPAHRLVIAGKAGHRASELERRVHRLGLGERVCFTGYVPAADLPALYGGAEALCFPSLYEGFGIPVLEAMACGTPVVTSNLASLPEVAGEAACLVDPHRATAIADGLAAVLGDRDFSRRLQERGLARAREFSWEKTARETRMLYREALA